MTPSSVRRSTRSSGAARTMAALVPSGKFKGTSTTAVFTPRIVSPGVSRRVALVLEIRAAFIGCFTSLFGGIGNFGGGAFGARGMKRQHVRDRAVERRRHADFCAELEDPAGQPADFQRIAALQVVVHRPGLANDSRPVDRGCDITHASHDLRGIVMRPQIIILQYTVLKRNDRGIR